MLNTPLKIDKSNSMMICDRDGIPLATAKTQAIAHMIVQMVNATAAGG